MARCEDAPCCGCCGYAPGYGFYETESYMVDMYDPDACFERLDDEE